MYIDLPAPAPVAITAAAPVPSIAAPVAARSTPFAPGDSARTIKTAIADAWDAARGLFGAGPGSSLPTAGPIDLQRYAGTWFELARLPTRFQNPRSVSTAEYALRPDGAVSVTNTAFLGDRVDARIQGAATVAAGAANDRLRVRFGGILRFIPVPKDGNYWIIDKEPDYSMALVGTPDRKLLWLLARDKDAWGSPEAERMVDRARTLGFDTDRLLVADWTTREMRP